MRRWLLCRHSKLVIKDTTPYNVFSGSKACWQEDQNVNSRYQFYDRSLFNLFEYLSLSFAFKMKYEMYNFIDIVWYGLIINTFISVLLPTHNNKVILIFSFNALVGNISLHFQILLLPFNCINNMHLGYGATIMDFLSLRIFCLGM